MTRSPKIWLPSMDDQPTVWVSVIPRSAPNPHEVDRTSKELMIADMTSTLERHGVAVEKGPLPYPAGGGPTPWTIAATAPLAAFFAALGAEAGKDAWRKLKELVTDLRSPPQGADVEIVYVMVRPGSRRIDLPEDLPDEAYRELIRIVTAGEESDGLWWDAEQERWSRSYPPSRRRRRED